MAFTSPFTAVVGATILAAGWNTSARDNVNAIWVYTAAGDLAYATSATTLSVLAKPAATSILQMTSSGVPSWVANTTIGGIHAKGTVDFTTPQTFNSTWADITSATLTLTLTATCTILVHADVVGYNGTGGNAFLVRAVVNGVADSGTGNNFNGGDPANRYENLGYDYMTTGITAGARIVKMQCEQQGTDNHTKQGRLIAIAFAE